MKIRKKKKIIIAILLIISIIVLLSIIAGPCKALDGEAVVDTGGDIIDGFLDGLVGVLLLPAKFLVLILGGVIGLLLSLFTGGVGGLIDNGGGLTIQHILFNKLAITDINFFDFTTTNTTALAIRENVATWYVSIRNLSMVVIAIIAVYVGIRMALSTIAEDKAKYKQMLVDWVSSLALLFVLHYIMIFTIEVNNALVNTLGNGLDPKGTDFATYFLQQSFDGVTFTKGMANAIIYLLLEGITFVFLLSYIKRMITLAFLIVISPLVTVTYSIDKMGDGKSQALNKWLKEFVYNILIQPFHCISYLVLGTTAYKILNYSTMNQAKDDLSGQALANMGFTGDNSLAGAVIAIMMFWFIYQAEDIVKKIFHFESDSMGQTLANAAIAGAVVSNIGKVGKSVSGGGSKKSSSSSSTKKPKTKDAKNPDNKGDKKNPTGTQEQKKQDGGENTSNRSDNKGTNNNNEQEPENNNDTNNTDNSNNPNNSEKQNKKRGKRVPGLLLSWAKLNAKAAAAIGLGTLGLSTGDSKAMIASGLQGYETGTGIGNAIALGERKKNMAGAVRQYKENYKQRTGEDLTTEQIRERASNLSDGTINAESEDDQLLRDRMINLQNEYENQGISGKEQEKAISKVFKKIDSGDISEFHSPAFLRGSLKKHKK